METTVVPSELLDAVRASRSEGVALIDPQTGLPYIVVPRGIYDAAMAALHREEDRQAILEGRAEIDRGEGLSLDEVRRYLEAHVNGSSS